MCVVQTPKPALITDPLIEVGFLYYCLYITLCVSQCRTRCSNWSTSLRDDLLYLCDDMSVYQSKKSYFAEAVH